jgi:hypothetical protein
VTASVLPASILSLAGSLVSSVAGAPVKLVLDAVSGWVVAGAVAMLKEVVAVISTVTTPSLSVSWFSTSYWQMAALATLLTLPFLFAAAVQAVIQTNLAVLVRAAFVDLPIAAVGVTLAAPLITLLLAATDQMCSLVGGGGTVGGSFLTRTATDLSSAGSGFMLVVIAVVILLAGMVLLVELIMRSAAIYIVVLFLPIGFAAMVWPARRVWIKRMLETLVALILSKFAMVAILSMSVAALASLTATPSALTTAFTAMALTVLAAFSPWALLRLLPFTELAVSAASTLRQEAGHGATRGLGHAARAADLGAGLAVDPVMEGLGALRSFVSGNTQDDADAGLGRIGRLARSGGADGGQLPPGGDAATGGGFGPGSGPEGGGSGGQSASILPADSGDSANRPEAGPSAGAGLALVAGAGAGVTGLVTGARQTAAGPTGAREGAGSPADAAPSGSEPGAAASATGFEPTERELGSPSRERPPAPPGEAGGFTGRAPAGATLAGGELLGAGSPRGAGSERVTDPGIPTLADPAELRGPAGSARGPVDDQAAIFANSDSWVDLSGTGTGFIASPGELASPDRGLPGAGAGPDGGSGPTGDQPEASDA